METSIPRYYSQFGEDFLLWQIFDHRRTGFYADVGAFDGVYLSNTFSFEQQGWSGICIEPHLRYFQLCKRARPRSICLNRACVANDGVQTIEFYAEELGLLSGVRDDRGDDVRSRYQKRGLAFRGFDRMTVPASTLNAILSEHLSPGTEIDFISIDVEGTEMEVLQGLDLARFQPRVLVIEENAKENGPSLNAHLLRFGYRRAGRLAVNVFYARDRRDVRKLRSATIDCRIEMGLHPLGKEYTLPYCPEGRAIRGKRLSWGMRRRKRPIGKRIQNRLLSLLRRLGNTELK